MNRVYCTKAIAGAGKSFLVSEMTRDMSPEEFSVCCADDYLTVNGKYTWTPERAGAAHAKCYRRFLESLIEKVPNIFLANCNLKWSDIKTYVKYANLSGYGIWLVEPETWWRYDPEICYIMNQHGLTLEKLQDMKSRMQSNEEIAGFAKQNLGITIHY